MLPGGWERGRRGEGGRRSRGLRGLPPRGRSRDCRARNSVEVIGYLLSIMEG